jgi:2,5-diamino-6-(ribosylamino)-4(3H)-pyrimidinone 5'-phosphate reductase
MTGVYDELIFSDPPVDRPYVFINMVSTIDGKITTGGRDEPVQDLGSKLDHATMRQIEAAADAVLIGAGTLRSVPKFNYPQEIYRFVASRSGNVDPFCNFFTDDPSRAFVVTSISHAESVPEETQAICVGADELDFEELLGIMRHEMDIRRLLVEGGSHLNAQLFALGLIDEIFLTLAPKIRLGADIPTIADGEALERSAIQNFELVKSIPVGNELFLRYRRLS